MASVSIRYESKENLVVIDMSKAKHREQRNILLAVAVSAIVVLALFMYTGYNPITQTKKGMGLQIALTNTNGQVTTYGYNSPHKSLTIISESGNNVGTPVQNIAVNLDVTPAFSGAFSSYTLSGTFTEAIYAGNTQTGVPSGSPVWSMPSGSAMSTLSTMTQAECTAASLPYPPTLTSGSASIVQTASMPASSGTGNMQSLYSGWQTGQYYTSLCNRLKCCGNNQFC